MPDFPAAKRLVGSPAGAPDPITLSVHEACVGDPDTSPAVVFSHGFPDLAFGWCNQLSAVAEAGFRAIAPDQRGYGASSAPPAVEDYRISKLTGDLIGLPDFRLPSLVGNTPLE